MLEYPISYKKTLNDSMHNLFLVRTYHFITGIGLLRWYRAEEWMVPGVYCDVLHWEKVVILYIYIPLSKYFPCN